MTTSPSAHGPTLTRDAVRSLDRRAIDHYGVPGLVLMENAGRNAAALVRRLWPAARRVAIACGSGNNAGDGFVIARHLELAGLEVRVLLAADPARQSPDAAAMFGIVLRSGPPHTVLATADGAAWRHALGWGEVVVDALLGTGAVGPPRGTIATVIEAVAALRRDAEGPGVFAVDLPSGLDADSGAAPGPCIRADATGTFVARKRGFDAPASAAYTGAVHVLDIGAPRAVLTDFGLVFTPADRPARVS